MLTVSAQNPVIRRIQFGVKNVLCDNTGNQLRDKKLNLHNINGKMGIENIKKEVIELIIYLPKKFN